MKITKVELKNFQGNHALSLDFPNKPVVLVAGHNWSGKSTILDAIRYALIGRTAKTGVERPATDNSLITDAHLTVPPRRGRDRPHRGPGRHAPVHVHPQPQDRFAVRGQA